MKRAWLAALLFAATALPAGAGPREDYVLHCQGCHRPDGGGTPGAVPALRGQMATFLAVPGGRAYLVRVPGTAQSALSDARVAALLDWMLRSFDPEHLPADTAPYSAEEVARARARPLADATAERRRLLSLR